MNFALINPPWQFYSPSKLYPLGVSYLASQLIHCGFDNIDILDLNFEIPDTQDVLKKSIELIKEGFFSPEKPDLFHPLVDSLLNHDQYLVLADFEDYCRCQKEVDLAYRDRGSWTSKAIINVARMGKFSSDRTINEYNRDIWNAKPITITRED